MQEDKRDKVDQRLTYIKDVAMKEGRDGEILKVIFDTDQGKVTYKPKIDKIETIKGIRIMKSVLAKFDEVPDKVLEIAREVNKKGGANYFINYMAWTTQVDGKEQTYRYVQGEPMLNEWKLQETPITEEAV